MSLSKDKSKKFNLEKSELKQIIPDTPALGWERQQEGTDDAVTWKTSPGRCCHLEDVLTWGKGAQVP